MFARVRNNRFGTAMSNLWQERIGLNSERESPDRLQILEKLRADLDNGEVIVLRKLHDMLGMDQPAALRCIRDLETRQLIALETHPHDLLETRIRLTDRGLKVLDETADRSFK